MEKFKGSKGNWSIYNFSPTEKRIVTKTKMDIAIIDFDLNSQTKTENNANAKLISAAPELLEACQNILKSDYGCAPSAGYMDEMKRVCEKAVEKALK